MDQSDKSANSFLRELKRRKVTKTCLLYVLLCWGVLQVGDILFEPLDVDPETAARNFLYLAIAGFPVTFAIAWFLQITPSGIVRTSSFVERRVLSNIPPINDRRHGTMNTFFRKGQDDHNYDWIISAVTGPLEGLSYGISHALMLGRSLDCDIAIVSSHVSRHHARLDLVGDQLLIEDQGSANGTVVNGKLVDGRRVLQHEDEIRFHDIVFRVTQGYSRPRSELDAMNQTTFIDASEDTTDTDHKS